MKKLHKKQQALLDLLIENQEYPLSVRELQELLGLSTPSLVHHHILQLEKKGYLKRDPYNPKNYQIIQNDERDSITYLNLYGLAQCGANGTLLDGDPVERIPVSKKLLQQAPDKLFLVRAKGDSMSPKINEGDLVIAEKNNAPERGNIVVCTNEGKAMIKKFDTGENVMILTSINDKKHKPIITKPESVHFEGIVRGVLTYDLS